MEKKKETKNEKFIRLAENRTNNAIKYIELICNLANKNNYEYTKEDAEKIVKALKNSVNTVERAFSSYDRDKQFRL